MMFKRKFNEEVDDIMPVSPTVRQIGGRVIEVILTHLQDLVAVISACGEVRQSPKFQKFLEVFRTPYKHAWLSIHAVTVSLLSLFC